MDASKSSGFSPLGFTILAFVENIYKHNVSFDATLLLYHDLLDIWLKGKNHYVAKSQSFSEDKWSVFYIFI